MYRVIGTSDAATAHTLYVPDSATTLFVQIDGHASDALTTFAVSIRTDSGGAWWAVADAAADFTSPAGRLLEASGDLTALAATAKGYFSLAVNAVQAVYIQASAAVAIRYSWQ